MIDFENIVENLLREFGPTGVGTGTGSQATNTGYQTSNSNTSSTVPEQKPQNSTDNQEEITAKGIVSFLKTKEHNRLDTDFKLAFKNYFISGVAKYPVGPEFEKLIYTAAKNSLRDTEDPEAFPDIETIFPLLDLIALVKQTYTDTKGNEEIKQSALNGIYDQFIDRLKHFATNPNLVPLDYNPKNPWAASVKKRYFDKRGKIDIGKLKLESMTTSSIYKAVMELLEHKRHSRIRFFNKTISIGNAANYIDNILFHPDKYIQGHISFPDKKINLIYAGVTPDLLLDIAKNSWELFEQQIKEKQINVPDNEKPMLYQSFLKEGIVEQLIVKESFVDNTFSLFCKILNEAGVQNGDVQATFVEGNFTIGNIIKYSNSNPAAKNLYNSLKILANHIKTEIEGIDLKGVARGVSQIAQGLSLGAKMIGT